MRALFHILSACMALIYPVMAEVSPVAISTQSNETWVGQRTPFYIELRARGSFAGSAVFDLPQIPGAMVMKIGEPVVGSTELEGESWFTQRHEFALFSQRAGPLEIPPFTVRFSRREGFTGDATDLQEQTTAISFKIKRPPGTESIGFLITTESLDITETWEPAPGTQPLKAKVGAVFKRTIRQRSPQIPGMALAPVPSTEPDGIRIYPGNVATNDKLARGAFLGERNETITYLLQQPGILEIPPLTYAWWNPKTETLESKTLPAVSFDVAPPPAAAPDQAEITRTRIWPWLLPVVLIGLLIWQKNFLLGVIKQLWQWLNPPSKQAARKLLRACRQNNHTAANSAWLSWHKTQASDLQKNPDLNAAIMEMQRHVFGPSTDGAWHGKDLAYAFRSHLSTSKQRQLRGTPSTLPSLNP